MVVHEYSTNIYKSLNISIGTDIRNPEILNFAPDYFKTLKKNMQFKTLPFVIRYVLDQYKNQRMCNKAILENCGNRACSWLLQKSADLW